ncbi:hypothetical protein BDV30DRAFT_213712 [Aspergillus minisclerotigenes]|uniref:Secreted protein n=1 Tax=Aspergillus minisclerotigenes TaxID=656917 RepID=A0A5N6IXP2_9EURO|nr:hypothetical protein BDV30DRAFT_213712 [Aspergillus minisclerotigenes]
MRGIALCIILFTVGRLTATPQILASRQTTTAISIITIFGNVSLLKQCVHTIIFRISVQPIAIATLVLADLTVISNLAERGGSPPVTASRAITIVTIGLSKNPIRKREVIERIFKACIFEN